jgi:uncharacterized protein (TIGR03067 family)
LFYSGAKIMNAIMQWFDDPRLIRLGLSLVHFLWQGALLGVTAAILMNWMRGVSSRRRYAVLLTAMFGMAIAPLVTFSMLPSPLKPVEPVSAAMQTLLPAHEVVSRAVGATETPIAPPASPDRSLGHGAEVESAAAPAMGFSVRLSLAWGWIVGHLSWFVAAWAVGVGLFSVRLMIGLGGASRVRRIGVKPAHIECQAWIAELATSFGIRRPINVGQSALVKVPVVVGWLRPIVLLPASVITGLPEPELRAILAHELAHIRRHDYLVNTLQTIVETLLFYHPAMWWLSNAIRQEREQCCDDLAADACGGRTVVAKALVRLAEVRALAGSPALAATGGRLSRRIRRLLTRPSHSKQPARWQSLAGAAVAILLAAGILISVNTFTGGFAESQASAQEPALKTNDIQDASQAKSDGNAAKDSDNRASKGLPVLSELPFVSRLFTMPAKEEAAGAGNEKPQTVKAEGNPKPSGKLRPDRTEMRRFPVEQLAAPISLDYREVSLDKVLEGLRDKTNLSIIVDESALKRLNMTEQRRISVTFSDIAVKDALRLILLAADPRLTYQVKEDCLFVTAPDEKPSGGSGAPPTAAGNADPLKEQLRRLEQQNEETRRELIRLEEQLRAEREKASVPSKTPDDRRATDADSRQARAVQLVIQLKKQEAEELTKLAGTWRIIATHFNGREQSKMGAWMTCEFRGHDVSIDQKIGQENEGVRNDHHSWTYHINSTKVPKEMTIYGTDMLMQAIYQLDGDTLKICYFGFSEHDRPSSFEPTKDNVLTPIVWTFRRVKADPKQSF